MLNFIGLYIALVIVEFYSYQVVKQVTKQRIFRVLYLTISAIIIGYIIYGFSQFDRTQGQNHQSLLAGALIMLFYLPKVILTLVYIFEDLFRIGVGVFQYIKRDKSTVKEKAFLPERRKFITQMALAVVSIPFASVLYGITIGRYKFQVHKTVIEFDDLPEAFDGFTLTQLSDIHAGSFDNREKLEYAVELINSQPSDMLVFTGDIVNSIADEMYPWIDIFQKIRPHTYGNYSILGNHDYGSYVNWPTEKEKEDNFLAIQELSPSIGFQLLRNEHVKITKGQDSMALVGVENWGARMKFMKYGDLDKATDGLLEEEFKILLTHDPSHWEGQVLDHQQDFHLTLSGHTHGSQFGIDIPGVIQWSPIQYIYKQWAGLYAKGKKHLYVNRGFGYHAYQGRTGVWPEITVIELRSRALKS